MDSAVNFLIRQHIYMEFAKSTRYKISLWLLFLILFITISDATPVFSKTTKEVFPAYSKIQNNILFWEKIYSVYSTHDGVVHDRNDLSKVYSILHFYDQRLPGASRLNRAIMEKAKKKYARILTKLGKGSTPTTKDERRIASLFKGISSKKNMHNAAGEIRVQRGMKERFEKGFRHSGKYITKIRRILRSYNVPTELAYLPHVESSFNVEAYSKHGAAGIWQFTRSTGKEFMTINSLIDERRDPFLATHAAAKFLKRNHAMLGSWPLAITAYNYGPSGMKRALKDKGSYERIFASYKKGRFKFAARNFYSEFLAAKNIAKRMEHNPRITQEPPLATHSFRLQGYVHVHHISNHFRLGTDTLQKLNPSLRNPIISGEKYIPKGYLLKVPSGTKNKRLLASLPHSIFQDQQKRSKFYRVRKGDTAGSIARAHKISVKKLSHANNLNSSVMVYVGQKLRIPSSSSSFSRRNQVLVLSNTSKLKKRDAPSQPLKISQLPIFKNTKKNPPSHMYQPLPFNVAIKHLQVTSLSDQSGVSVGTITVQPGESLAIYAEWLQTSRQRLRKVNKLDSGAIIHPEQQITIPFESITRLEFENKRIDYHQETEKDFYTSFQITGLKMYKVSAGDTLWDLCNNKFDLPYWLLKKYNSDVNINRLAANQKLNVPIIEAL